VTDFRLFLQLVESLALLTAAAKLRGAAATARLRQTGVEDAEGAEAAAISTAAADEVWDGTASSRA